MRERARQVPGRAAIQTGGRARAKALSESKYDIILLMFSVDCPGYTVESRLLTVRGGSRESN